MIFLLEALIKPLRISIDKGPDKPPRVYSIRPVVMMIAIVSLLLAAAMVGSSLTPQKKQTSLLAQLAHRPCRAVAFRAQPPVLHLQLHEPAFRAELHLPRKQKICGCFS